MSGFNSLSNQPSSTPINRSMQVIEQDDFISSTAGGALGWFNVNTGTGFAYLAGSVSPMTNGVCELSTGSTTASSACQHLSLGCVQLGSNNTLSVEYAIRVVYGLSNATDRFQVMLGLGNLASAEFTNGVYAMYDEGTDGQFWVFKTANGGTRSKVVSTVPVTLNTWTLFRFTINGTDSASCTIQDGTNSQTLTLTSNLPVNTGLGPAHTVIKQTGIASRGMQVDWFDLERIYGTPRYNFV
jgi:hypothetical protein